MARGVLATKNTKAMKPSGVAWLGDIPEGWEMRRLKTCFSIVSGSGFKEHLQGRTEGDYPVFKARDIGKADVTLNYSRNWITSDEVKAEGFKIIPANSILMPKIGEAMRKNSRAISGVACCVDNNCQGLLPRKVDVKLSYYLLYSIDVRAFDNGGTIPCINNQAFLDFSCPLPPLPEQRTIADYLDEKCGAIDAAVAEAKKGIEEYKAWKKSLIFEAVTGKRRVGAFNAETRCARDEVVGLPERSEPEGPQGAARRREAEKMKSSGIPWIGDVPEGWCVCRVKNIAIIQHGQDPKTDGDIPVYGSGEGCFKTCGEYKNGPTVLIGRKGATLHIPHYIEGKYWNVDTAFDVKMKNSDVLRWFYYLAICFDYKAYMSQTTLPSMTQSDYRNMVIPLPAVEEQQATADYLDEKCAAIDAMVAEKEALIADLESYKKSLIYETVTGKREVK